MSSLEQFPKLAEFLKVGRGTKWEMIIAPCFLEKNNAWRNLSTLKSLYANKYFLYGQMELEEDWVRLQMLHVEVIENELKIQKAFNFKPDHKFIRFWEFPKCSCPKLDNMDSWGTGRRVIVGNCTLHGVRDETTD